ncbi:MAG TPA: rhomboid family intramembrane serine protease [Rhodocyclaceae bacterium]|nr:rhomboid family intramembrane serine protease [Rhodocyclaceae bacterium]
MPPVIRTLLIINVVAFLRELVAVEAMLGMLALWPFHAGFMPWQPVTYAVLHGSVVHLAVNLYGLWLFGGDLERLLGVTGTAAGIAHFADLGGMLGGSLVIRHLRRAGR